MRSTGLSFSITRTDDARREGKWSCRAQAEHAARGSRRRARLEPARSCSPSHDPWVPPNRGALMGLARSRHRDVGANGVRAAVLGAGDGLLTNVSLILGVAGASPPAS